MTIDFQYFDGSKMELFEEGITSILEFVSFTVLNCTDTTNPPVPGIPTNHQEIGWWKKCPTCPKLDLVTNKRLEGGYVEGNWVGK